MRAVPVPAHGRLIGFALAALIAVAAGPIAAAAELRPAERETLAAFERELGAHAAAARVGHSKPDAGRLTQLARERRQVLKRLVREDPEQALAVALDRGARELVPAGAQGELELEVSAVGSLEVVAARPLDASQPPIIRRQALVDGQHYDVSTWGAGLLDRTAARRSLHGVAIDGVLALSPSRLRQLRVGERPASGKRLAEARCPVSQKLAGRNQEPLDNEEDVVVESGDTVHALCSGGHIAALDGQIAAAEQGGPLASAWTTGTKSVLYIIAKCSGDAAYPQTVTDANSMMTQVKAYFEATSWNQTSLTWTICEVTLPQAGSWYQSHTNGSGNPDGDTQLLADARAAARTAGFDTAGYNLDIVRHPSLFGWGGQGYVGGKGTWLQSSSAGVAEHELGHNYGLWHANFWNTSETSVIGDGTYIEYGDTYSAMGSTTTGQFTAFEKWALNWIPAASVQTITSSGTYRVHASDSAVAPAGSAMHGLRIRKDAQRDYWISHRREFASNRWAVNGVFLHWDPWYLTSTQQSRNGGMLLDTTPGSVNGRTDAALVLGRTFSDRAAGIHITPMALNTGTVPISVDVVVNVGTFAGNRAPTVSLAASASAVAINADVTFTATASDPDGDVLAVYWDLADTTFASNTLTTTKSWSSARDYPVRVTVSDRKGGTASATAIITVGTVTAHRISGRVRTGSGVGVEGVRVHAGSTSSSVWTASDGSYTLVNLGAGTYTVGAVAYGYDLVAGFANPVTVGPSATGKDFTATSNSANARPTATPQTFSMAEDGTRAITLAGADADSPTLSFAIATSPAHGTLTGTPPSVTYQPAANWNGSDSFTFTASDGDLTSTPATIAITVTAVNDPPTISAIADRSTITAMGTGAIAFTVGDPDTAAASLTVGATSSNTALVPNGNLVFGGSGTSRTITVTPAASGTGTATITVTVSDGSGGSDSEPFVLTVNAPGPAPTPVVAASATDTATPTLSGTTMAGGTVRIYDGATLIGTVTADGSGAWSWTAAPPLADGGHALTATATGGGMTESARSAPITVTVGVAATGGGSSQSCGLGGAFGLLLGLAMWQRSRRRR